MLSFHLLPHTVKIKLLLILIISASHLFSIGQTAIVHTNNGAKKVLDGDLRGAVAEFEKAIELDPDYEKAYFNMAICQYKLKDYKDAVESLTKVLAIKPGFYNAIYYRAYSNYRMKAYDAALEDFAALIKKDPRKSDYYRYRADIFYHREDFAKAAMEYETMTQIKPTDHFANYRMAMCMLKLRKSEDAIKYLDAAIAAKPEYKEALGERGVAKLQRGDKTGCDDLKKAVELGEKAESVMELIEKHCK